MNNMTAQLTIMLSDPWELGEALKWQPLQGNLLRSVNDEKGGQALIKLEKSLEYRDAICRYVIASPRHEGVEISNLSVGKSVLCGLTGISEQQAESSNPFDLSSWRGGIAFIGDVKAVIRQSRTEQNT